MIPKTIHYCWFGKNPKPKLAKKCIKSWKKYCPDYKIIEWNEDNFDISSAPLYVRQAYECKKWAFVTDYVRLKIVYEHGGIYLDTDVELIKNIDFLLNHTAYFGFEGTKTIATGLGFGAEKGTPILQDMMADYNDIPFIKPDGSLDTLSCPTRNTSAFLKNGLIQNGAMQTLDGNILILPSTYLCPCVNYLDSTMSNKTESTVSIHHFAASWFSKDDRKKKQKIKNTIKIDYYLHAPNRMLKKLLGDKNYGKLKSFFKNN